MSVKLRKRKNSDGSTTLLLDIYNKGERKYEFLQHLRLAKVANINDRQKNKENLDLAQKIAIKRAHELAANEYSMVTESGKKSIVTEWMQTFVNKYQKKDVRNMQGALNRFKDFLTEEKKQGLTFGRIDDLIISDFQEYLIKHSTGEGASSYFSRFKKMMKRAYQQKLMDRNPASDVPTIQGKAKRKDTLTLEEIENLRKTDTESKEVKRASLFCCMTGLRWIDVKNLTWGCIRGTTMTVTQIKTGNEIFINLNKTAVELLGKHGKPGALVFDLPTANGANKSIKAWVKRAKIEKKITFHNFRHSFGTNLIFMGADVTTASSLLGHSTLKHTSRYVKASKELKEMATNKLNLETHEEG